MNGWLTQNECGGQLSSQDCTLLMFPSTSLGALSSLMTYLSALFTHVWSVFGWREMWCVCGTGSGVKSFAEYHTWQQEFVLRMSWIFLETFGVSSVHHPQTLRSRWVRWKPVLTSCVFVSGESLEAASSHAPQGSAVRHFRIFIFISDYKKTHTKTQCRVLMISHFSLLASWKFVQVCVMIHNKQRNVGVFQTLSYTFPGFQPSTSCLCETKHIHFNFDDLDLSYWGQKGQNKICVFLNKLWFSSVRPVFGCSVLFHRMNYVPN